MPKLTSWKTCPKCGSTLMLSLNVADHEPGLLDLVARCPQPSAVCDFATGMFVSVDDVNALHVEVA